MGFLRKGLFVATGGLSGAAGVKANSKKERIAKALEEQNRTAKRASGGVQRVAMRPLKLRMANYDGRCIVHPTAEASGTLVINSDGRWELHFQGTDNYMHGPLNAYDLAATQTGRWSSHITMTKTNSAERWSFDLPKHSPAQLNQVMGLLGLRTPAKSVVARPTMLPQGVAAPFPKPSPVMKTHEPPPSLSVADELGKLAQLRDAGVLTDDEFQIQKAKLLGPT